MVRTGATGSRLRGGGSVDERLSQEHATGCQSHRTD
jgi:hypothetical protein